MAARKGPRWPPTADPKPPAGIDRPGEAEAGVPCHPPAALGEAPAEGAPRPQAPRANHGEYAPRGTGSRQAQAAERPATHAEQARKAERAARALEQLPYWESKAVGADEATARREREFEHARRVERAALQEVGRCARKAAETNGAALAEWQQERTAETAARDAVRNTEAEWEHVAAETAHEERVARAQEMEEEEAGHWARRERLEESVGTRQGRARAAWASGRRAAAKGRGEEARARASAAGLRREEARRAMESARGALLEAQRAAQQAQLRAESRWGAAKRGSEAAWVQAKGRWAEAQRAVDEAKWAVGSARIKAEQTRRTLVKLRARAHPEAAAARDGGHPPGTTATSPLGS